MKDIISAIIIKHRDLFGANPSPEQINVGFTNLLYTVNNKFIVKICVNPSKEAGFLKEIEFYNANKKCQYIPALYFADTSKTTVPHFYEIMEKLSGQSLYNLWHTFSESQRENIVCQLCNILKEIHSSPAAVYDWAGYNKQLFAPLFEKAKKASLFTCDEIILLEKAYSAFDKYLQTDKFTFVHNDLHFDNVIYYDGKIKLIDFERALSAPVDFELDILYRMVRKPWKFASEATEEFTHPDQYKNIMEYIGKYYPQITTTPFLYQRLAVYDMIYFLKQYVNAPQYEDLKQDVLAAARLLKD